MKKILLCCASGFSTSILLQNMYDHFDDNDIEAKIKAVSTGEVKDIAEEWDIVMVAPQMSHLTEVIKESTTKPVISIPPEIYQNGSGKEVCELALRILEVNNNDKIS